MTETDSIFVGDSEMARLMREHDWAATPLGPPAQWPNALKVALRLLLTSRFEMWLGWGPDIHFFYNDAYRPTLGIKHPRSLGMPTRVLWSEIWDQIKDRIEAVYQRGEATWDRALLLVLERSGFPEETYHTFSYSPLIGDTGAVEGLFCAVTEETDRVISERRLGTLRELATRLSTATDTASVVAGARAAMEVAERDFPFSLLYLQDGASTARLATRWGIDEGHPLAPAVLAAGAGHPWWPAVGAHAHEPRLVELDPGADVPRGPWSVPPRHAVVVPIASRGGDRPAGLLVAGLNPYRPADEDLQSFASLFAGQVGASLANAAAHDQHLAERNRLRALFDEAPSFFAVVSGPRHVFELANASYRRLVGGREVEGKTVMEALPEVVDQGFVTLLDDVYRTGQSYVGRGAKVVLKNAAGESMTRYVDFVYQPIRDLRGQVSGIFVEGFDVSDKLEAEHALRSLNATLEQRVQERTLDLARALDELQQESLQREQAEDALRQAQKMEAVGQLTGGIAHDFNNLLQGITGSLDLLKLQIQMGRIDATGAVIERAMNSARRAAAMTHRLLAFSRRQALDPKPIDVNELLPPMQDLLVRTMGENIRVEFRMDEDLWQALCDANQLENAILNLCINARDAMPDGGMVTIETANESIEGARATAKGIAPGEFVRIAVRDTGSGMSEDVMSKAFEPFYTTKPIGQGTGLGLSMVYGFVKQSRGHVELQSDPGQGTTVLVYLPRHRGETPARERSESPAGGHAAGSGEVLLVVEDEPVVRALVVELLQGLGYVTLEAGDGAQALRILQSGARVDLLVTDVGLPVINGRQLYDAAVSTRPGLKVLFMTGYAEKAFSQDVLEENMDLITKPFAMQELAAKVRRMLEGQAVGRGRA